MGEIKTLYCDNCHKEVEYLDGWNYKKCVHCYQRVRGKRSLWFILLMVGVALVLGLWVLSLVSGELRGVEFITPLSSGVTTQFNCTDNRICYGTAENNIEGIPNTEYDGTSVRANVLKTGQMLDLRDGLFLESDFDTVGGVRFGDLYGQYAGSTCSLTQNDDGLTCNNMFANNICYSDGTNCASSSGDFTNVAYTNNSNVFTNNQTINGNLTVKGTSIFTGNVSMGGSVMGRYGIFGGVASTFGTIYGSDPLVKIWLNDANNYSVNRQGLYVHYDNTPTTSQGAGYIGGLAFTVYTHGVYNKNIVRGVSGYTYNDGDGNITEATGLDVWVGQNAPKSKITTANGVKIYKFYTNGLISTYNALDIGSLAHPNITNPYAINQRGADDFNFLNGNTTIGSATRASNEKLRVDGQIKQYVGNSTINYYYGQIYNKSEAGYSLNLITVNVYENVTGMIRGDNNGFDNVSDVGLKAEVSGTYAVNYDLTFEGNGEYGLSIFKNGVQESDCYNLGSASVGTHQSFSGSCIVTMTAGQFLTLMIDDHVNPVTDPTIHIARIRAVWLKN